MSRFHRPPVDACRSGFTLLEVVVALGIGGLVMLSAHALVTQLGSSAEEIAEAAEDADRAESTWRWIRWLLLQAEPADGVEPRFIGDASAASFLSWCEVPQGWQERCEVRLSIEPESDGTFRLLAATSFQKTVVVRSNIESGELLYLYNASSPPNWLREWRSIVLTPLALGMVLNGDTLILRIGERG